MTSHSRHGGIRDMALSHVRKEWLVSAMPRPLYPRERDKVPIVHEAKCALGPVWTGTKKKKRLCVTAVAVEK